MTENLRKYSENFNLQEKSHIHRGSKCMQYLGILVTNFVPDIYKYYKTQWNKR